MTLVHNYDLFNRVEPSVIYLAKPGKRLYTSISGIDTSTVNMKLRTNDTAELSFTMNKYVDGMLVSEFDEVNEMMELYCSGIWFKIVDPPSIDNDSFQCTKEVTAESYEIGLSQYTLNEFNINNGESSAYNLVYKKKMDKAEAIVKYPDRKDDQDFIDSYDSGKYYSVKLYDPDCEELNFLNLALKHADVPMWKIGTVDHLDEAIEANKKAEEETDPDKKQKLLSDAAKILPNRICNFQVNDKSVFSFFTQEAATAYDCVFEFDTENMLINVHDIKDFGKDTNIIIGFRNIQNKVSTSCEDSMVTQFYVDGLDDYGIDQANYGSSILTDLSYFAKEPYMDSELVKKYKEWSDYRYSEDNIKTYMELSKSYNSQNEVLSELKNRVPVDTAQNDWFSSGIDDLVTAYNDNVAIINGLEALYIDENNTTDFVALKRSSDWPLYESIMNYTLPSIVAAIQSKDDSDKDDINDKLINNDVIKFTDYGSGNILSNVNPIVLDTYWIPDRTDLAYINAVQLGEHDPTNSTIGAPIYSVTRGIRFEKRNDTVSGVFGVIQKKISITPNTKYTISCFVKADDACTFQLGYRLNGEDSDFIINTYTLTDMKSVWQKISYTFSTNNHLIDICFKNNETCTICGMQLELGDSATNFGYFIQSEDAMKAYETDWKLYGIDELQVKISTYDKCIKTLEKNGLDKPYQEGTDYEEDYVNQMYRTYEDYKKIKSQAESALKERQAEYDKKKKDQDSIQKKRIEFSKSVTWEKYGKEYNDVYIDCNHKHIYSKFTEEELLILRTLVRQATYSNENIITTSLTTTESAVDKCKELYDDAVDELYAESHPQYEYTDEVENIYALPEFKEYHDQLKVDDFVYLEVDDGEYVKLRVTEISYNPCDMDESMEITFTSPTVYKTKRNDFAKILDAAINKASHDGGTVQGVNKASDTSSYIINSDVIQRLFSNPIFSTKTTGMTTNSSGDITANKIAAKLLTADESILKKITSEIIYSDYVKAKERYAIYNKNSNDYQDIIWYSQNDYANSLKIGLMGRITGTVNPINAYLEFKDDNTITINGNLDVIEGNGLGRIQSSELQVLNKADFLSSKVGFLSDKIIFSSDTANFESCKIKFSPSTFEINDVVTKVISKAAKENVTYDQIQTSNNSMAFHITKTTLAPYTYDDVVGWQTLDVTEYANRADTPSFGTTKNMFNSLYLAGGIRSLGVYNTTLSSGNAVYVNQNGSVRRYVASSSSMRLKNHIKEITYDDAKALLDSHIFSFRYNPEMYSLEDQNESKRNRYGFILEDLEKTFPMAVEYDENGLPSSWCLQIVVPTHLAITKKHEDVLNKHDREINQLKLENEQLRKEINLLKQNEEEIHEIPKN